MSAKNEVRENVACVLLVISWTFIFLGLFANSDWRFFLYAMSSLFMMAGGFMFMSLSVIKSGPWMAQIAARHAQPVWAGEILHTDGGQHKVRYLFDDHDCVRFVASDICVAIGGKAPLKDVLRCGGVTLFVYGGHACFSEKSVQEYLIPHAPHNHAANRLLTLIRNNVLRKLDKQRETVSASKVIESY